MWCTKKIKPPDFETDLKDKFVCSRTKQLNGHYCVVAGVLWDGDTYPNNTKPLNHKCLHSHNSAPSAQLCLIFKMAQGDTDLISKSMLKPSFKNISLSASVVRTASAVRSSPLPSNPELTVTSFTLQGRCSMKKGNELLTCHSDKQRKLCSSGATIVHHPLRLSMSRPTIP